MSQRYGVRPEDDKPTTFPIFHCDACGAAVVWCWDDMYPEDENPLFRRQVNFDPVCTSRGDVVLWFMVDQQERPISRQFFRRMAEVDPTYAGETWRFHSGTCTRKGRR